MTNHAELSRDLALAIGYRPDDVLLNEARMDPDVCFVWFESDEEGHDPCWRKFDYRDADVWGPVLEWLIQSRALNVWSNDRGRRWGWSEMNGLDGLADTLPEAVARAAIAVKAK